jgi:hypothetical protein
MTQVGESVNVIAGTDEKWQCPFSHDPVQNDHDNDFAGDGGTLGERLEAGQSTSRNPQYGGGAPKELDPRHQPGHALNKADNPLPVNLIWNDLPRPWPVTCAAHHLVPSGDALAKTALLEWLIKKGTTAQAGTKTGSLKTVNGKVDNNVGYDVNGAENGVWLPGPYAMRGIWTTFAAGTDAEDDPGGSGGAGMDGPAETHPAQFEYAVVTMKKARAQFHDAHRPYSKFVLDALNLVANKMREITDTAECEQCRDKIKNSGPPAPYSLIDRLNAISKRLRERLEGGPTGWKVNLWTSKWALEYMNNHDYHPPHNP